MHDFKITSAPTLHIPKKNRDLTIESAQHMHILKQTEKNMLQSMPLRPT